MKKLLNVVLIALAVLGVLFIILMLIPDDDENEEQTTVAVQEDAADSEEPQAQTSGKDDQTAKEEEQTVTEAEQSSGAENQTAQEAEQSSDEEEQPEQEEEPAPDPVNTVQVNIPASEISGDTMRFKTLSLNDDQITQDIFSGYDLTLVHMWGTYCGPCIKEMGEYADLYKELPDNVNLVGLVIDVYDGLDNNVSTAKKILSDAGAEFTNMRTSDGLNKVLEKISYVPSSFFVDGEGHIIGNIMDGAGFDETKARLESYIK